MIDVPTGEFRIVPVVDRRTVPAPPSGGAGRNGDLRVEALTAWFGQHCVLADVDLRMPARRVSSILGP